uniref:Uncharacterized protein n=1 Tax=Arundo donax TaxID=35708 RepID=A0A0A9A0B1_ARUDO
MDKKCPIPALYLCLLSLTNLKQMLTS